MTQYTSSNFHSGFSFFMEGSNIVARQHRGDGRETVLLRSPDVLAGQFYMLTLVSSVEGFSFYLDGDLVDSLNTNQPYFRTTSGDNRVYIGDQRSRSAVGSLKEILIVDRVLSRSEIYNVSDQ